MLSFYKQAVMSTTIAVVKDSVDIPSAFGQGNAGVGMACCHRGYDIILIRATGSVTFKHDEWEIYAQGLSQCRLSFIRLGSSNFIRPSRLTRLSETTTIHTVQSQSYTETTFEALN